MNLSTFLMICLVCSSINVVCNLFLAIFSEEVESRVIRILNVLVSLPFVFGFWYFS